MGWNSLRIYKTGFGEEVVMPDPGFPINSLGVIAEGAIEIAELGGNGGINWDWFSYEIWRSLKASCFMLEELQVNCYPYTDFIYV